MTGLNVFIPPTQNQRFYGVTIGVVTNNQDPKKLGRVKVKFPWFPKMETDQKQTVEVDSAWARVATPMAGKDRGIYCLPEVNDEVLVAFEHGQIEFPYILGALWNGQDNPPETNKDGQNNVRMIKSRSGHIIRLTDEASKERIEIIDKSGNNCIVIDTAKNTIAITGDKDITLSAPKGTIKLEAQNVEITSKASGSVTLQSGGEIAIESKGTTNIKGTTINLN